MHDHDVHAQAVLIRDVLAVFRSWYADRLTSVQEEYVRLVIESHVATPRQGDLFASVPAREVSRIARVVDRMLCGDNPCPDPLTLQIVKLASVIADLRAGRPERVQPWEASAIAEVLGPAIGKAPAGTAHRAVERDRVPDDAPVEFRFTWPSGPTRMRRTSTATALAGLSEVDSVDAPVTCSLRTVAGQLEIRRLGSRWLRPVLSPGSWEPVTLADFRWAVGSGDAWRDNPFLPRAPRGCPDFHLRDRPAVHAVAHADERRMSQARDACLARAGELVVIEGVVHRSTSAPMAGVCTVRQDGVTRSCAAWMVGDLGSTSVADTLARDEAIVLTWFNGMSMPDPAGGRDPDGTFVPLSDWAGVVRLLPGSEADQSTAEPSVRRHDKLTP